MNKYLSALVIFIFVFWWVSRTNVPSTEPVLEVVEKNKDQEKKYNEGYLQQVIVHQQEDSSFPDVPKEEIYRESKRQHVDYRVVKGQAIAFGDILLGEVKGARDGQRGVYLVKEKKDLLWPTSLIPYGIHRDFPRPERIDAVVEYFNLHTPIRLVPWEGEEDGIFFVSGEEHCYSYLGRRGGHQPIVLSDQCEFREIVHEVMHALGFIHEQSRPERDNWIEVLWDNIRDEFKPQFSVVPVEWVEHYRGPPFVFDYNSIMIYRPNTFAKGSDMNTMRSKTHTKIEPTRNALSPLDMERLYLLYGHL